MKERRKALIASGVAALGIYTGCKLYNSKETNNDSQKIVIESVYNEARTIGPIQIKEEDFKEFNCEQLFTLFSLAQLYDYDSTGNYITPDTLNNRTVIVRGISTNGTLTLIELPNGEKKYVYSNDIVKTLEFDRNEFGHINDLEIFKSNEDYTVNKNAYVYNREGVCIGYLEKETRCLSLARVDNYIFVLTENDEYLFIDINDITLTKDYKKGLIPPRKLNKSKEQLDEKNIYFYNYGEANIIDTVWSVHFNNEVFTRNPDEPYATLLKNQLIYFNNGNISPVSYSYGIVVKILKQSDNLSFVRLSDGTTGYVNNKALCNANVLDRNSFAPILTNRNQITKDWDYFYDLYGAYQYPIYPNTNCLSLETNGEFTLVELEDGTRGYLKSDNLIESKNQVSKFVYLKPNANFYYTNSNGEMVKLDDENYKNGIITYLFYIDGEYAYVGDYLCRENYYVKLSDIDFSYNVNEVFSYGYTEKDTNMNSKIDGSGNNSFVDDYDLYWIYYNCGDYSYVYNERTGEYGYIKTSELNLLEGSFYYVDLNEQRVYYYDDHDGKYYYVEKNGQLDQEMILIHHMNVHQE